MGFKLPHDDYHSHLLLIPLPLAPCRPGMHTRSRGGADVLWVVVIGSHKGAGLVIGEQDCEMVEFSPTELSRKMLEIAGRNMAGK